MNKLLLAAVLALFWGQCYALSDEEKGLQIMQEVDRRDTGFGDSSADVQMILRLSLIHI